MSRRVLELISEQFPKAVVETHSQYGDETAVIVPWSWREVGRFLKEDPRTSMKMFIDLTAVDYLWRGDGPRFEVVCHLRSLEKGDRIRIKTRVGEEDGSGAEVQSLTSVWKGANWFERECFDMFGIVFKGHPDLRRILMYPEFQGYPLRKDYDAARTQPLVPYRDVTGKLPPFGPDEGMSFGRQSFEQPDPGSASPPQPQPAGDERKAGAAPTEHS